MTETLTQTERKILKVGNDITGVIPGEVVVIEYPKSLVSEDLTELVTGTSPRGMSTLSMVGKEIHVYDRVTCDGRLVRPLPLHLNPNEVYQESSNDLAKIAIYGSLYELLKSKGVVK